MCYETCCNIERNIRELWFALLALFMSNAQNPRRVLQGDWYYATSANFAKLKGGRMNKGTEPRWLKVSVAWDVIMPAAEITPGQVETLCHRMGFEIRARFTKLFAAQDTPQISHGAICTACKDDAKCCICGFNPNETDTQDEGQRRWCHTKGFLTGNTLLVSPTRGYAFCPHRWLFLKSTVFVHAAGRHRQHNPKSPF